MTATDLIFYDLK